MKAVIFLVLLLSISCSSNPTKKVSFTSLEQVLRSPSSVEGKNIKLDSESLPEKIEKDSFYELIKMAQVKNYEKIVIENKKSDYIKVSTQASDNTVADFIVLIGTNFSEKDELIRKGDYDDLYQTIRRVSWLNFRATINLVASVDDLSAALKNTRPTIIVWTSHGDEQGFYDFNQVRVQNTIFKNASPTVYQFILTSCNGSQAIQNSYKPYIPKTMMYWSWNSLVYHPSYLGNLLNSTANPWSPFENFPEKISLNDF